MPDKERISALASRLRELGCYADGGRIHIKPSHRGRLTELKERTGKSEAELYNDGNPAHKKMVVFARNSRKWHADGGPLLRSFDMGGDTDNNALAKAIIARVNQEEAARARAEGAPMMGEAPLENEDYLLGAAAASVYGLATAGLSGVGNALARGINWFGEKAMPSALLKSPVWKGATARALSSIAPYADAAALAYWSTQGANASREAKKQGDTLGAVTYGGLAALPVAMPLGMRLRSTKNPFRLSTKDVTALDDNLVNDTFYHDDFAQLSAVKTTKPLTEAERLGIHKGLRANSKALEDPYYWGYEQWNQRYNDAVRAGNMEEAQRLRDLHFQTKAINNQLQVDGNPITLYHGNIGSDSQLAVAGYNPNSTARTAVGSSGYFAVTDPQIALTYKGPSGSIKTVYGYSKNPVVYDAEGRNWQNALIEEVDGHKFGVKTDDVVNSAFDNGHDAVLIDNVVDYGFYTPASHPRTPFTDYVLKSGNVKLKDAVVEDGLFFEPIPIVKRDNFHNPDIRYGAGGIMRRFDEGGFIDKYGIDAIKTALQKIRSTHIFAGGGSVAQVWKERTGKDWSEVGDYYKEYDKSLQGNLRLLQQLNSGQYDYLKTGEAPQAIQQPAVEQVVEDVGNDSTTLRDGLETFGSDLARFGKYAAGTVKEVIGRAGEGLLSIPDYLLNGGQRYREWKETDTGDYTYNPEGREATIFDFSQAVPPEEAKRVYSKFVNGEPMTEWEKHQCATFITEFRQKMGEGTPDENNRFISNNNYRGDAWTWLKNAQDQIDRGNNDVSVPYNLYSEGFTGDETKEDVINKTREIAKTQEYKDTILNNIGPGSVVTLLYPGSGEFGTAAQAFKEGMGTTLSTHLGQIVERDGKLYVQDNVGGPRTNYKGHIHYRPLESVLNGKDANGVLITGIANYAGNQGKEYYDLSRFGFEPNMDVLRRPTTVANASAYRELDAIDRNKGVLMEKYGIGEDELRELTRIALGVSLEESFMGTSENWKADASKTNTGKYAAGLVGVGTDYDSTRSVEFGAKAGAGLFKPIAEYASETVAPLIGGDDDALIAAESKGLSNIKYRGDRGDGKALFTLKELEELGLTKKDLRDKRIMESPEVSGVMTVIALKKKRDEITDILKDMPDDIKNDKDLTDALLYQSWNQGTKKIRKAVSDIQSGKSDITRLLQFKDASLRPQIENDKGELVDDDNWYADRIARNVGYWKDNGSPMTYAMRKNSLYGLNKDQLKYVQRTLISAGFLPKEIDGREQDDGKLGPRTRKAFREYMEARRQNKTATSREAEQAREDIVEEEPAWSGYWSDGFLNNDWRV